MAFLNDVRFPTGTVGGSGGGPGFRASALVLDSGAEARVAHWAGARRQYDGRMGLRHLDDLADALDIYLVCQMVDGFRFKDWQDYSSKPDKPEIHRGTPDYTDVVIGVGDGSQTKFQLIKKYTAGSKTITRTITKPVAGTVRVGVDGTERTITTDFTVDTSTGEIQFTGGFGAPGSGLNVTAGFEFDVPVLFGSELGDVLFTQIRKAIQDGTDKGSVADFPQIPLIEDIGEGALQPEVPYLGGGTFLTLTADTIFDYSNGLCQVLNPTASGVNFYLPALRDLPYGAPVLHLLNANATNSLTLLDRAGSSVGTLGTTTGALLAVVDNAGTKEWRGFKGIAL